MDGGANLAAATVELGRAPARAGVPRQRVLDLNQLTPALHLGSFTGRMRGWGFIRPEPWRNYLHSHSYFEVCYAFRGRGIFRVSGKDYVVEAGDVFVARPGEPHEIVADAEDPLGIYFWSYILAPAEDQQPGSPGTDALLRAFLTSDMKVSRNTRGMQRILELLTEEIAYREPGYADVVDGLVVKLVLDTARAVVDVAALSGPPDPPARSTDEALVQTMIHYLRDNYRRPICLRDVAAQVHLSERHCSRLFHAATGVSIMRFLAALRMDIAAQLLLDRQLSIKEVAMMSGYPDVHHFMTRFRQHMGITPTGFRQHAGLTPTGFRRPSGTVFLRPPGPMATSPSPDARGAPMARRAR